MRFTKRPKSAVSSSAKVLEAPVVVVEDYSHVDLEAVQPAASIEDLMARDGAEFVECCYLSLLLRPSDPEGMAAHMHMLAGGYSKAEVAYQLARSSEAHEKYVSGGPLARAVFELHLAEMVQSISEDARLRDALDFAREQMQWSAPAEMPPAHVRPTFVRPPAVVVHTAAPSDTLVEAGRAAGLWLDVTTAFEWGGGVVGIVRAELEIAVGLKRAHPDVRFSMQIGEGFAEIKASEIQWLLDAENVTDAYMAFFGRYDGKEGSSQSIHVTTPESQAFFHPYVEGDTVLSVGWMDSRKEVMFERLKKTLPGVYVGYLVYDIIMIKEETSHFYPKFDQGRFYDYLKWISYHADFILCGGETAKLDVAARQKAEGWPSPPSRAIKFGADIMKTVDAGAESELLAGLGVTGPFMITVGSIEGRKNHDTLYRAYLLALEMTGGDLPQLVVCGRPYRADDFVDVIDRDPRLEGKMLRRRPTDAELAALYKHCAFTLLPSLYEGWSLTLPESLTQGKFCIAADNDPLREVGRDLVEYVAPFNVRGWAEKMVEYASNPDLLAAKEARIAAEWQPLRWQDTAAMIEQKVAELVSLAPAKAPVRSVAINGKPTIWMDLTLTYLQWEGGVTGVIRAELTYAYYLKKLVPDARFFAWQAHGESPYFIEIQDSYLSWLFESTDLTSSYKAFHEFWLPREREGVAFRNPFFGGLPSPGNPAYLPAFPDNSVVFFAGIDFGVNRTGDVLRLVDRERGIVTSQIFYDFTPFLLPQFHIPQTPAGYVPFFKFISEEYDQIVYGGRTAMRDGLAIQAKNGWRSPISNFIEFGSDLAMSGRAVRKPSPAEDAAILEDLGITGKFVMTVGTIEPRKNHEMLYKAYLNIMERDALKDPLQMVFVGHKGWKSNDFLETFNADERVKGKVLHLTPTDDQLDVLYRHCAFTMLASFYEGWSLTLPESLSYSKFCLVSDVDPLKETGGDLVEYIHPLDTHAWAERIEYYANNPKEVTKRVNRIKSGWKPKTWEQATADLVEILYSAHEQVVS